MPRFLCHISPYPDIPSGADAPGIAHHQSIHRKYSSPGIWEYPISAKAGVLMTLNGIPMEEGILRGGKAIMSPTRRRAMGAVVHGITGIHCRPG